ncbi:MAG TPA: CopG family transcriptional regulator [Chloroflexota bacterium]
MEVHRSARKHGIADGDIEHVVAHALVALDEENDEGINQALYMGWMHKSYGTSGGVEITDKVIERLADEAERGYDPARLRPRGRPTLGASAAKVAQVRLPPDLSAALDQRATRDHTKPSEIIRQALREYLKPSVTSHTDA